MRRVTPESERFWPKVDLNGDGGCWLWTAYCDPQGYPRFGVGITSEGTRRVVYAHRWAYESLVGPIPAGLQLDHLCRVRNCVNPNHLEPVTGRENHARGSKAMQTHCINGHEFTVENTYVRKNGCRTCRACKRERARCR